MAPSSVTEPAATNGSVRHVPRALRKALAAAVELEVAAARLHSGVDDLEAVYRQLGRSWSRLGRALAAAKRERALARIRVIARGPR